MTTPIIDVYWEGPYTLETIDSIETDTHCLYQVYGRHPLYGENALLYIGKTEKQTTRIRIKQHQWIGNQADVCQIYVATCGVFTNWKIWQGDKRERYQAYDSNEATTDSIESLLIHAHQPSYNSQNLKSISPEIYPFRIFNSGRRSSLLPEISTQFYTDPNEKIPSSEE